MDSLKMVKRMDLEHFMKNLKLQKEFGKMTDYLQNVE